MVDIFKLEHGRIIEHWDVTQSIPEEADNRNGSSNTHDQH